MTIEMTTSTGAPAVEPINVEIKAPDDGLHSEWRDLASKMRNKYSDNSDAGDAETPGTEADDKPKTAKERAQAKIDQRNYEREARAAKAESAKHASEKAELAAQLKALTEADPLTKIGGPKGLQQLVQDINEDKIKIKDDEKLLSPAEQVIEDLKKQVAELAAAKAEQERTLADHAAQEARKNDDKVLAEHLTAMEDEVPALVASGQWGLDQLYSDCSEHFDNHGEAPSLEDIKGFAANNEAHLRKQIIPLVSSEKSLFAILDTLPPELQAKAFARYSKGTSGNGFNNTARQVTPTAPSKVVRTNSDQGRSTITAADKTVTRGFEDTSGGSFSRDSMLELIRQMKAAD